MRRLLDYESVPRGQDRERDLVRHRRRRADRRLFLAEERAARASSASTVGSSRRCSSPTSAKAIAARIADDGVVCASERRSITALRLPTARALSALRPQPPDVFRDVGQPVAGEPYNDTVDVRFRPVWLILNLASTRVISNSMPTIARS